MFEKLNVRITEIGQKYKEPKERPPSIQTYRGYGQRERTTGGFGTQREKKNDWKKIKRRKFGKRRR